MKDQRTTQPARGLIAVLAAALVVGQARGEPASIGPRELFRLGGIDDAQWDSLASEPWGDFEREVLRRMLYRMAQDVRRVDLETWSHGRADLERLAKEPRAYRAEVFDLRGRVVRVEAYPLVEQAEPLAAFSMLWRCRLHLEPNGRPVEVLAAKVPDGWRRDAAIDEPSAALAFFLTPGDSGDGSPAAMFLAERMAWHPPTFLGRLGMDVGLLDDVRVDPPPRPGKDGSLPRIDWQTRQLTEADHESFYQMLAAVGRAGPDQLSRWAEEELREQSLDEFSVVPLFNQPHLQQGRLLQFSGVARRILPVRVAEPEVIERFGIDRYFQVYLFTDDSQDNPLVFCLRELPEGLPTGDGPGFGERLTVPGFFFKTWSYRIADPFEERKAQRQLAPLLIGKSAVWHPAESPEMSTTARLVATLLLVGVLGAVWLVFRRFGRGDRQFEQRVRRRRPAEISTIHWNRLAEGPGEGPPGEGSPGEVVPRPPHPG